MSAILTQSLKVYATNNIIMYGCIMVAHTMLCLTVKSTYHSNCMCIYNIILYHYVNSPSQYVTE